MDTPLNEVAKDVAEALGLGEPVPVMLDHVLKLGDGWVKDNNFLNPSGRQLTDPYWRCACEDWLLAHGWDFDAYASSDHKHMAWHGRERDSDFEPPPILSVGCPWPEAPARLVSAVWRKQRDRP